MNDIITQLTESTKNGATFMTFLYTSKGTGETSKYQINFGIDYKAACDHDRKALVAYVPSNELEIQAKEEMMKSLTETLEEGVSSAYTQKDTFETLGKGVRQHKENGMIYIYGYVQNKEQVEPPTKEKKAVNSRPLTLAKKDIEKACDFKRNRFAQFIIDPIHIGGIKVKGDIIELHP
jgi:hypothetical protein